MTHDACSLGIRSTRAEKAIPALYRHIKQGATPSSQDIRGKGADLVIGTSMWPAIIDPSIQYIGMKYVCMVPPLIEQSLRSVQVWIAKNGSKEN